jgi:hypothetical protein
MSKLLESLGLKQPDVKGGELLMKDAHQANVLVHSKWLVQQTVLHNLSGQSACLASGMRKGRGGVHGKWADRTLFFLICRGS